MADRWMDERDREWRERDWRRSEAYGRGGAREGLRRGEDRSWSGAGYEDQDPFNDPSQARDFDDEEDYSGGLSVTSSGSAYSTGRYGEGYGGRGEPRLASQDYAGRRYGQERGASGYERTQGYTAQSQAGQGYRGQPYGGGYGRAQAYGQDRSRRPDYDERSYGYERDREERRAWRDDDDRYGADRRRRESWEEDREHGRGEGPGDFLQRAGERIKDWFRGDHMMRGSREDDRDEARRYREDLGREARGHRGVGPKGYQRSDERISDEVHQRLTDDPWLDASDVHVEVKGGEVTLSGYVDNREAKHRAERLVEDLSGVRHVQNNLRVNPTSMTGAGRGFGSSALEAEMRRNEQASDPGARGASGLSGRTSTGAAAERSDTTTDPKTGGKRT